MAKILGLLSSFFTFSSTILLFPITYKREKNKLLSEILPNFRELYLLKRDGILTELEVEELKKEYLN